jgi:hypothetical protein
MAKHYSLFSITGRAVASYTVVKALAVITVYLRCLVAYSLSVAEKQAA